MRFHETFEKLDKALLLAVVSMLGIGLVQVYSSSFIFAIETYGDGLFFFKKQLIFTGLAFIALVVGALIPFDWLRKYGFWAWFVAGGLLVLH